jgi:hypothetical protein
MSLEEVDEALAESLATAASRDGDLDLVFVWTCVRAAYGKGYVDGLAAGEPLPPETLAEIAARLPVP